MTRLVAATLGAAAARTLGASGTLRVVAAFDRSAYVRDERGGLACIGGDSLAAGPLNARCTGPWPGRRLRAGMSGRGGSRALVIGGLRIEWADAHAWSPPRVPAEATADGLGRAGAPIAEVLARRIDAGEHASTGLAPLGLELLAGVPAGRDRVCDAARARIQALLAWLSGRPAASGDLAALIGLLGLGPGLTPSGDDLLGALLIALRAAGKGERADALGRALLPAARARTSEIGRAHLACAAAGAGTEALHDLLVACGAGTPATVSAAAARLSALGHSSGLDMLVGVGCAALALGGRPAARAGR